MGRLIFPPITSHTFQVKCVTQIWSSLYTAYSIYSSKIIIYQHHLRSVYIFHCFGDIISGKADCNLVETELAPPEFATNYQRILSFELSPHWVFNTHTFPSSLQSFSHCGCSFINYHHRNRLKKVSPRNPST